MNYEQYLPYARPQEREKLEAIIKAGSINGGANALGQDQRSVRRALKTMRERVAREDGFAPEAGLNQATAPSEILKGRSFLKKDEDGTLTWYKTAFKESENLDMLHDVLGRAAEKMQTIPVIKPPQATPNEELCTVYTLTDFHLGMLAWEGEGGEHWDLPTAKSVMINAFQDLIAQSPPSEFAIFNQLGDFLHFDGLEAVTPASRHILDASGRYGEVIELAIDVICEVTGLLLQKHRNVKMLMCEGNHDESGSLWLRIAMNKIFADNPRVEVNTEALPFYAEKHGDILLGFHHGHKVANKRLPMLFASEPKFRKMWGQAEYTYIHTGHYHHQEQEIAEGGGAIVERHPTLSARDAYSARGGYVSWRCARAVTYHKKDGELSRTTAKPRVH